MSEKTTATHFLEIKAQHPDKIILYQMGDFYESLFEDAKVLSQIGNVALTSKGKYKGEKIPLAGVPLHTLQSYLIRLINAGHSVVIVDQTSGRSNTKQKKREITQIITPGTLNEDSLLNDKLNPVIATISGHKDKFAISWISLVGAEFFVQESQDPESDLTRINPNELLVDEKETEVIKRFPNRNIVRIPSWKFSTDFATFILLNYFKVPTIDSLTGQKLSDEMIRASGVAFDFICQTQPKTKPLAIRSLKIYKSSKYLFLDNTTRLNLEIDSPDRSKLTLLSLLDNCQSSGGSRMLKEWLHNPLLDHSEINDRLDFVSHLIKSEKSCELNTQIRQSISKIKDLQRISSRLGLTRVKIQDLMAISTSLRETPHLNSLIDKLPDTIIRKKLLKIIKPETHPSLNQLEETISPDAHLLNAKNVGIIRRGFNPELDKLDELNSNIEGFLSRFEQSEKSKTGINNLRVSHNRAQGFFIEVTHSNLNRIPEHYIRTKTLKSYERFTTPELLKLNSEYNNAKLRMQELEEDIYQNLVLDLQKYIEDFQNLASAISSLDVLSNFALMAEKLNLVRPELLENNLIELTDSRHLLVESRTENFTPNDLTLNREKNLMIITGPNMGGKSTVMRQVALIALLAKVGCYVPATKAKIGNIDRIFTRIGANDEITSGKSTFMVEMSEAAMILNNATPNSLVLIDEIGRGTSTFDGLSLAWAICEHIAKVNRSLCMFSTHYFELTTLDKLIPGVFNQHMEVIDHEDKVVFLHKLRNGAADRSYGLFVAKLAGLPQSVIDSAKNIMTNLITKFTKT